MYLGEEDCPPTREEPEEGICQWALDPGAEQNRRAAAGSPSRLWKSRRWDRLGDGDDDEYESQMHFYLHQTNRADGSMSRIEGQALQSTLKDGRESREMPAFEVMETDDGSEINLKRVVEESSFEIENIEIMNIKDGTGELIQLQV